MVDVRSKDSFTYPHTCRQTCNGKGRVQSDQERELVMEDSHCTCHRKYIHSTTEIICGGGGGGGGGGEGREEQSHPQLPPKTSKTSTQIPPK